MLLHVLSCQPSQTHLFGIHYTNYCHQSWQIVINIWSLVILSLHMIIVKYLPKIELWDLFLQPYWRWHPTNELFNNYINFVPVMTWNYTQKCQVIIQTFKFYEHMAQQTSKVCWTSKLQLLDWRRNANERFKGVV